MDVKIVERESFDVVGLEIQTSLMDGQFMTDVNDLIEQALTSLVLDQIPNRRHAEVVLGISSDLQDDGGYTFLLGAEVIGTDDLPEGTVTKTIPAARYAVVTAKGEMPFSLMEAHEFLRETWLPDSGYSRASSPSFEVYSEKAWETEQAEIDIFIPLTAD